MSWAGFYKQVMARHSHTLDASYQESVPLEFQFPSMLADLSFSINLTILSRRSTAWKHASFAIQDSTTQLRMPFLTAKHPALGRLQQKWYSYEASGFSYSWHVVTMDSGYDRGFAHYKAKPTKYLPCWGVVWKRQTLLIVASLYFGIFSIVMNHIFYMFQCRVLP